jgi:hypothetical protein
MKLFPSKRRVIRIGIVLAMLVAFALLANGFMIWRTDARLQAKIDAIRAAGDPAIIADLAPDPIPADQNAAAYIENLTPRLDEFDRELARFYDKTPVGQEYGAVRERDEAPSAEQLAAIRAIIDKYPDIDVGIAAASSCRQYASLADFSLNHQQLLEVYLERIQKIRTMARFAAWRMEVLTSAGQADAAVRLGIQVLRLARLFSAEPLLVSHLVGIAVRMTVAEPIYIALSTGDVSVETSAELDEELMLQDDPAPLLHVLKTERVLGISYACESGVFATEPVNPLLVKLLGWPMKSMFVNTIDVYEEYLRLADKPWYEIHDRFDDNGAIKSSDHGVLSDLLEPALGAAFSAQARNQALLRCLGIANALAEYRLVHGSDASSLDDLPLPKEATIDPFSGEPLKLKHTADGWTIYTVMENGVDDGGNFANQKDHGFTPRKHRATE